MPRVTRPLLSALAVAMCVVLASCPEVESGVGQGPTGHDGSDATAAGTESSGADIDSGVDDTSGAEILDVPPPAARSYFIAESMDFSGNGCENTDLNDVTESLQAELNDEGWVGRRATEGQTRPADFVDPTLRTFGQDHLESDAVTLAVYAGHGGIDKLGWGTRDHTPDVWPTKRCIVTFSDDIRLGSHSGGWAKTVALLTSCTGRLACYKSTLATNDLTQVFAFNNSPIIWSNAARRFYRKSEDMSNRDAWITAMDNRPGFKKNSPVVYTRGTSEDEVLELHQSARLPRIEQIPSAQGTTWFAYTWVDHGLHGDCKLPSDCVGVDD
ncbi:MAG: hypothetical protein KDK70_01705 [Myxococcales bacterium]|nr:hypothetical protein [Myxococcales bacterium]